MSLEQLRLEVAELKMQLQDTNLKNQHLTKELDNLKSRNDELIEVNGRLFSQLTFEKPKEVKKEIKDEKIDLTSIEDLEKKGIK